SKEHLIPDSLGGQLILNDWVCSECNRRFGAEFDHEILKNPEIVAALEKLKLSHNRAQLINQNFRIRGFAGEIEVKGRATRDGFEFPPQSLPDESVIYPETEYKEPLLKSILRDQRLYVRDHRVATRGRHRSWCLVSFAPLAFSSGPDLILPL